MADAKIEVVAMAPEAYARAPWNKWHWRIAKTAPGIKAQSLVTCCVEAKRQERTCVGFDTRDKALAAGCVRRSEILSAAKSAKASV